MGCAPPVAFLHLKQNGILPSFSHILLLSLQHIDHWQENYIISYSSKSKKVLRKINN